jgi:hypothetical protein
MDTFAVNVEDRDAVFEHLAVVTDQEKPAAQQKALWSWRLPDAAGAKMQLLEKEAVEALSNCREPEKCSMKTSAEAV